MLNSADELQAARITEQTVLAAAALGMTSLSLALVGMFSLWWSVPVSRASVRLLVSTMQASVAA